MRHSQNLDLVDPTRPLSLPSVMDSAETTWTLLTPPLPSQTPSTLLTCPLTDPPVSSWSVDPSVVLPHDRMGSDLIMSHNASCPTDSILFTLCKTTSTSQVSPLDMAVAAKSLSSLHHDPNILSAINVTAPHASQNFRHIYTQAGTPTSIGLNDPLLSGQQDLISLTELSNVRLQHEVKVSSIEPKVVPMMFETPSSSTPYLFTSRIHEDYTTDRPSATFVTAGYSGDLLTPSASSSGIGSLESADEILTLSSANSSTPIVVTSVRVKPSIGSDFSVKDYPVKMKLSDADVRLLGATLAGSASDASQNNFPTVPQTIRIISSQQHHQSSIHGDVITPIHLLPDGPVIDPTVPNSFGTHVRLVPHSQQQQQQLSHSQKPSCLVQIRPLQQQQQQQSPCIVHIRPMPQQQPHQGMATKRRSPVSHTFGHEFTPERKSVSECVEEVACFKCSICGFLSLTSSDVHDHMRREHDLANISENTDVDWLEVAQRENIFLECPFCSNTFQKEGFRSFTVHLTDDHDLSEAESHERFAECSRKRREKTLQAIRQRHEEEEEVRRQKLKSKKKTRETLEAYVTSQGELRVRAIKKDVSAEANGQQTDKTEMNDMSAQDYIISGAKRKAENARRPFKRDLDRGQKLRKRQNVGRPMGSRSTGLTRLKRINPNIELSDRQMGVECRTGGCAVRLRDPENLAYHRKSHRGENCNIFDCIECSSPEIRESGNSSEHSSFGSWQRLALHLWRVHRLDMELYSCPDCSPFRSFTKWRLEAHRATHVEERPFLCSQCGKRFKTAKNLKLHSTLHVSVKTDPGLPVELNQGRVARVICVICERTFSEERRLKHHIEIVHEKKRPHLCSSCGHAAASKSSLKLHVRKHTGEKPYSCDLCDYKTGDHNSLRRHKMRHSGLHKYQCPHCPYSSIQSSTYKVHLKSKHPDHAGGLVFQCGSCVFRTVKEANYLAHIAEHDIVNATVTTTTTTSTKTQV